MSSPNSVCTSRVSICPTRAWGMESNAYEITNFIHAQTTPEAFDLECSKYPSYQLTHGGRLEWTALEVAIKKGNIPLVEHIVKKGGVGLLSHGGCAMPLNHAVENYTMVKKLVDLGANVNMILETERYTPLRSALRVGNLPVVKFLLMHGAVASPEPGEKQQAFLKQAEKELKKSREPLTTVIADAAALPVAVADIAADYVGYFAEVETAPQQGSSASASEEPKI